MKRPLFLFSAALALVVASASALAAKPGPQERVTVSTTRTYAAGSGEAKAVLEWVAARSPEYSPVLRDVSVDVARKATAPAAGANALAASTATPDSALPGDAFTATTRDRHGNTETWGYAYSAAKAGWVLVEYRYRSVTAAQQDRPQTVGG